MWVYNNVAKIFGVKEFRTEDFLLFVYPYATFGIETFPSQLRVHNGFIPTLVNTDTTPLS